MGTNTNMEGPESPLCPVVVLGVIIRSTVTYMLRPDRLMRTLSPTLFWIRRSNGAARRSILHIFAFLTAWSLVASAGDVPEPLRSQIRKAQFIALVKVAGTQEKPRFEFGKLYRGKPEQLLQFDGMHVGAHPGASKLLLYSRGFGESCTSVYSIEDGRLLVRPADKPRGPTDPSWYVPIEDIEEFIQYLKADVSYPSF